MYSGSLTSLQSKVGVLSFVIDLFAGNERSGAAGRVVSTVTATTLHLDLTSVQKSQGLMRPASSLAVKKSYRHRPAAPFARLVVCPASPQVGRGETPTVIFRLCRPKYYKCICVYLGIVERTLLLLQIEVQS